MSGLHALTFHAFHVVIMELDTCTRMQRFIRVKRSECEIVNGVVGLWVWKYRITI
jgi:hypothetical protein